MGEGNRQGEFEDVELGGAGRNASRYQRGKDQTGTSAQGPEHHHGVHVPGVGDFQWQEMKTFVIQWLKNPINMALVFWTILSIIPSVILVLLLFGVLNGVLSESDRENWILYCNLTLNALFVLMCLVWHPRLFQQTFQLIRWREKDRVDLRNEYSRGGMPKPHERFHIAVILFFFHVCCFAMYVLFVIWWVYRPDRRPVSAATIAVVVSTVAPIIAVLWNAFSSLGREYHGPLQQRLQAEQAASQEHQEKDHKFVQHGQPVHNPRWKGRMIRDCLQDKRVACYTCCCPCCIFGYNTERVGLGSRVVQALTFFLMVAAPVVVFIIIASAVTSITARQALVAIGIFLSFTGLFYGGWWRSRMRKKYGLPGHRWCCYSTTMTDCFAWFFCPYCALCQEVRTANQYELGDHTLYTKEPLNQGPGGGSGMAAAGGSVAPLPHPGVERNMQYADIEQGGQTQAYDGQARGIEMTGNPAYRAPPVLDMERPDRNVGYR